jgi:hypothetical protein
MEWMREHLLAPGRISAADLEEAEMAEGPEDALATIYGGLGHA